MINIVILLACISTVLFFKENEAIVVLTVSISTILLIIFGNRFNFEKVIEKNSLPGREAGLPVLMICIFILLGYVDTSLIMETFKEKLDIILLIFSFAMVSYGMAKSGSFEYLAYQIVEKCGGNTNRLIIYLFILSSLLTLITSNDIVILILTPIIYSICVHANIKNSKLLLLSQFVAANTLSMGLMVGSPTNIIIAAGWDITFFSYFNKMIIPAILSFSISLAVVAFINLKFQNNKSKFVKKYADWSYNDTYQLPAFSQWKHPTQEMKNWGYIFFIAIILLIVVTNYFSKDIEMPLLWVAIPLMIIVTIYIQYRKIINPTESTDITISGAFINIPYGILFFGIAFFIVAKILAQLDLVEQLMIPAYQNYVNNHFVSSGVVTIFISGFLVNIVNDLPASAILTEVMPHVQFISGFHQEMIRTAVLVGVNIGCYVTPVGALAGLIWLNVINSEKKRHIELKEKSSKNDILDSSIDYVSTPDRLDLIKYGSVHFLVVAIVIGLLLPFFQVLEYTLTSPPDGTSIKSYLLDQSTRNYVLVMGFLIMIFLYTRFKYIIRKNNVVLGHLSEIFTVANKFVAWSLRHRFLYTVLISFLFLGSAALLLNWSEVKYMEYHAASGVSPLFNNTSAFLVWLVTFISSSYEGNIFPRSMFGQLIAGALPLVAIGSILFVIRFTSSNPIEKLQKKLSVGDIPSHRVILINFESRLEGFVRKILEKESTHITLLCDALDYSRAVTFVNSINSDTETVNRVFVDRLDKDPYATFTKYNLQTVDEIYMFSKMTNESDYVNLKLMTKLDSIINRDRVGAHKVVKHFLSKMDSSISQYSFHDNYAVVGVPLVMVETSSQKAQKLVERSISSLLSIHCFIFEHTTHISSFLMAGVSNELERLNSYFGLPNSFDEIYLSNFKLVEYEIEESSLSYSKSFFTAEATTLSGKDLYDHSFSIRNNYTDFLNGVLVKESNGDITPLMQKNVVGLVSKISSNVIRSSFSSASFSTQSSTVSGVLCLEQDIISEEKHNTIAQSNSQSSIIIVNYTNTSHVLIKNILKESVKYDISILVKGDQSIPDWMSMNSQITIYGIDQNHKLGNKDEITDIGSFNKLAAIKPGDRIFIFADYNHFDISEQTTIDTIERIEKYMNLNSTGNDLISHADIEVSVESHNEEMRFLFEHLYVDKIIETTRLRRSHIELFGSLYYGYKNSCNSKDRNKLFNANSFFKVCKIIDQFKSYITIPVMDFHYLNSKGISTTLLGYTLKRARNKVLKYSIPPVDLAFIVKMKVSDSTSLHNNLFLIVDSIKGEDDVIIEETDLLLFFPNM